MPPETLKQQRALLLILIATCERALEAFQAADNALDVDFVADLERIMARSHGELDKLTAAIKAEA